MGEPEDRQEVYGESAAQLLEECKQHLDKAEAHIERMEKLEDHCADLLDAITACQQQTQPGRWGIKCIIQ